MAILHHKETKIQVVLGRLPKSYTHEQFVEMFIRLYSKDWGKIKSAYIKQSQDREPGVVINMPKPDLYLKQILDIYLNANPQNETTTKEKSVDLKGEVIAKEKTPVKKKAEKTEEDVSAVKVGKKPKTVTKKATTVKETVEPVMKEKAPAKEKKTKVEETPEVVKKAKVAIKKTVANDDSIEPVKKAKAPTKKKVEVEEKPVKKTATKK